MRKNNIKLIYICIYILLVSILTCIFLVDDLVTSIDIDNARVKFAIIISNNVFALLNLINTSFKKKKIDLNLILLQIGLLFTFFADSFLLFSTDFIPGVSLFIVAQIAYFIKLMNQIGFNKKRLYQSLIIRSFIFIILVIIMLAVNMFNALYFITMFYFTNLIMNLYDSIRNTITLKTKETLIFTIGLFLFILCDICVGISNLIGKLNEYIWLFYSPSQILIVMSVITLNKEDININKTLNKILTIILIIIGLLFIVSISILPPLLDRNFFYMQIDSLNLVSETGLSKQEIMIAYDDVLDFLWNNDPFNKHNIVKATEEGISHFADCIFLFKLDLYVAIITLCIMVTTLVLKIKNIFNPYRFKKFPFVFYSTIITLIFVLIIGIAAIIDFDKMFILFHKVFFPGKDNWQFWPDKDTVINILKIEYFMSCGILIGSLLLINSIIAIIYGIIIRKKEIKKEKANS